MSENKNYELQLERIVFFSDAVFAIAITLLIIEIKVPHLEGERRGVEFLQAVLDLLPKFIGYFLSFFVIGAYWSGHHRIYGYIERWDYTLVRRNIVFLSAIAFIPFATAFLSDYFTQFVPLALYSLTLTAAGLLELYQWRYAVNNSLTSVAADSAIAGQLGWRALAVPLASVVVILVWLAAPRFATVGFALIPVLQRIIDRRYRAAAAAETEDRRPEPASENSSDIF
ncbi:MAG: DUF1211 domain-containing protein [Acidobacteria bacterium]|nr:DUF1211 domain-containing protein [Acidobacteriota bacterium]